MGLKDRPHIWMAAALILFAFLVGYAINEKSKSTAEKAAKETTAQINEQARASAWQEYDAEFAACKKSNQGRKDAAERDLDIKIFAETAAAARIRDGDLAVAEKYNQIADRARVRQVRAIERIQPCAKIVPKPPFERPDVAPGSETLIGVGGTTP
jgi:hypothetical protein